MKASKREYFLAALNAGSYLYKRWVLEAFSVTIPNPDPVEHPLPLSQDKDGWYFTDEFGQRVDIVEPVVKGESLFGIYDEIVLEPGDVPNIHQTLVTTYGRVLANQFLLVYPFGGRFPFMDGELNPGMFDKIIEKKLVDDGEPNPPPNAITIEENWKYSDATAMLCEFTQLCVPTATRKTMTVNPEIYKRRAELLEKYKGRLQDPVVQTLIGQELIAMDREWMKGDPGEGFYFKAKSYDIVRKKLFLVQGAENGFDVQGEFIPTSLDEGWDIRHFPSMNNGLRDGSYNRGAATAKGGEATKFFYRIFQNTQITEHDCGSPYGLPQAITERNKNWFITYTALIAGKPVLLTAENIDKYVGKTLIIRSPMYCKTEGANFCATCIGLQLAANPTALSAYAAGVGSTFMLISMSAMHGKTMSIAPFVIEEHLT